MFALITLGGVVRATESGLGCPDWPLCNGDEGYHTQVEFSHRFVAATAGVLSAAVALFAWRYYRRQRWVFISAVLGFALLIGQAGLGGVTVLSDLQRWTVMVHLAMAQGLIALLLLVYIASNREVTLPKTKEGGENQGRLTTLAVVSALGTYGLMIFGSYVANTAGAPYVCADSWPWCRGDPFPGDQLSIVHMAHRWSALALGLLLAGLAWTAWRTRLRFPRLWALVGTALVLYLVQVFLGAVNIWHNLPATTQVAHLSVATALWMALVIVVILTLAYRGSISPQRSV